MALRNIVVEGDDILRKRCREVGEVTDKICVLLDDMLETMRDSDGTGIAAPQVGMLKRLCIVDVDPESEDGEVYELIDPVILEAEGEQEGYEGCLSVPGYIGKVKRPQRVRVSTLDREGNRVELEFRDFGAVVVSHEMDHLDGILYTDKAEDVRRQQFEPEEKDGEANV